VNGGARARSLALAGVAAALVALVVALARERAGPPARCAPGMIPLGPRCCGEGQRLDDDRCVGAPERCAAGMTITPEGCVLAPRVVAIEGGRLRIGPGDWEAQGVVVPYEASVLPFAIDVGEVSEARYAACVSAGACATIALSGEPGRPVSRLRLDEAAAFCRWAGGSLPSRDQLTFASAGAAGRRYPWGDTGAVCRRVAWGLTSGPCGRGATLPELAGSHPDGASPQGVLDLAGNVAEWTSPDPPESRFTEVRGGSFADSAANALRSWQRRVVSVDARSPEVGFRCVYPVQRGS